MKLQRNSWIKTVCVYVILTFTACLLITLFFIHIADVGRGLIFIIDIIMPFIIGFALAYLLARPVRFFERHLFGFVELKGPHHSLRRGLAIFIVFLILFCTLALLFLYIIPQLASSLNVLFKTLPGQIDHIRQNIIAWTGSSGLNDASTEQNINNFFYTFLDITKYMNNLFASAGDITKQVSEWLFKLAIGVIVSVYALAGREKFVRQLKAMTFAVFPRQRAVRFIRLLKYSSGIFLRYIMGVLLDALIVGALTFLFLWILGFPYPLLAAVIIAVTNIIPMFGPVIGAAACSVIIFVINPLQTLWFLIFIVILQQVDGNIIMPHIVGKTTRLQAFWVLFALILGGGLFGFWGLLLGVPIWAVLYPLIAAYVHRRLRKKGMREKNKKSGLL